MNSIPAFETTGSPGSIPSERVAPASTAAYPRFFWCYSVHAPSNSTGCRYHLLYLKRDKVNFARPYLYLSTSGGESYSTGSYPDRNWGVTMRTVDYLPKARWRDLLRDLLGLSPSKIELERRRLIARDWGRPPVKYTGSIPDPPPAPPGRK